MNSLTRSIYLLLFCLFSCTVSAEIKWLASDYNFGAFKEADGPRTGFVKFINVGDTATFIRSVRPSCGCTAAKYPKEMIQPGDTVTISFTYNPAGRPGPFDKTVKVYIGETNELKIIRITGTVIGSPETLMTHYPNEAGPLRIESLIQPMGEIKKGGSRHGFINIYNQSQDTVRPTWTTSSRALEVDLTPKALAPGEIGTFGIYLNTMAEKELGPVDYIVSIFPDGNASKKEELATLRVTAAIVPDISDLSVTEIEKAPRIYLVPEFIDFGDSIGSNQINFEIGIENEGGSLLKVSRVFSYSDCIKVNGYQKKVKSGKKGVIKGTLDAEKLPSGPFRISLEVITNDPLHPVRTANLVGVKSNN